MFVPLAKARYFIGMLLLAVMPSIVLADEDCSAGLPEQIVQDLDVIVTNLGDDNFQTRQQNAELLRGYLAEDVATIIKIQEYLECKSANTAQVESKLRLLEISQEFLLHIDRCNHNTRIEGSKPTSGQVAADSFTVFGEGQSSATALREMIHRIEEGKLEHPGCESIGTEYYEAGITYPEQNQAICQFSTDTGITYRTLLVKLLYLCAPDHRRYLAESCQKECAAQLKLNTLADGDCWNSYEEPSIEYDPLFYRDKGDIDQDGIDDTHYCAIRIAALGEDKLAQTKERCQNYCSSQLAINELKDSDCWNSLEKPSNEYNILIESHITGRTGVFARETHYCGISKSALLEDFSSECKSMTQFCRNNLSFTPKSCRVAVSEGQDNSGLFKPVETSEPEEVCMVARDLSCVCLPQVPKDPEPMPTPIEENTPLPSPSPEEESSPSPSPVTSPSPEQESSPSPYPETSPSPEQESSPSPSPETSPSPEQESSPSPYPDISPSPEQEITTTQTPEPSASPEYQATPGYY